VSIDVIVGRTDAIRRRWRFRWSGIDERDECGFGNAGIEHDRHTGGRRCRDGPRGGGGATGNEEAE
jgi:hypothetical protein